MQLELVASLVPVVVGLLVARRQRLIGLLLVLHGLSVGLMLTHWPRADSRADLVVEQLSQGAWVFMFLWITWVAYLLPDGHHSSRFARRWVHMCLLGVVGFLIGAVGSDPDGFRQANGGAAPPLVWLPPAVSAALGAVGLLFVVAFLFGGVMAVVRRLRRSKGEARRQLLWLVLGAIPVPITLLVGWTFHFVLHRDGGSAFDVLLATMAIALPVCIGIAVLRHRLFDIELVLSRTLVYVTLLLFAIAVYAAALAIADKLLGNDDAGGVLAVAIVAIAVHPAYSLVRTRIERLVYGLRSAPQDAIRLLSERAKAADPHGIVDAVTDAVREAVHAKTVVLGPPGSGTPVEYRGEHLGDLAVETYPGHTLSSVDKALLCDLAQYAAVLVKSERLNAELRESRSQLVTGREEERKRLRRDLHDGVGPSLAAIVLKLNAAQSRPDARARDAILAEAREEVKSAIGEIRRLVDDLRPPAIDEVGLVDAIRQRADSLAGEVSFEVVGVTTRPLPAAVEVAVFRISAEAMTNVVRHSGASRCRVELTACNGELELTVSDNGRGAGHGRHDGVGFNSMRDRAAEVGGTLTIANRAEGGTVVSAVLPLSDDGLMEARA
ncbi:hypothetical protein IEE94_15200 [Yimella sp. cx-573]|nr:hypothetical protein [Yimella sp. cx-573]